MSGAGTPLCILFYVSIIFLCFVAFSCLFFLLLKNDFTSRLSVGLGVGVAAAAVCGVWAGGRGEQVERECFGWCVFILWRTGNAHDLFVLHTIFMSLLRFLEVMLSAFMAWGGRGLCRLEL